MPGHTQNWGYTELNGFIQCRPSGPWRCNASWCSRDGEAVASTSSLIERTDWIMFSSSFLQRVSFRICFLPDSLWKFWFRSLTLQLFPSPLLQAKNLRISCRRVQSKMTPSVSYRVLWSSFWNLKAQEIIRFIFINIT